MIPIDLILFASAITGASLTALAKAAGIPTPRPGEDGDQFASARERLACLAAQHTANEARRAATRPSRLHSKCPRCGALPGAECDPRTLGRHRFHGGRLAALPPVTP